MADVTRTIGTITGSSSTIAAGITWLQANWTAGTDDIGYLDLVDAEAFNEEVQLTGFSGTPSATSYVQLQANDKVRHSGVAGTGHARISTDKSTVNRVVTIDHDYARVCYLEIHQKSIGGSDEGFRILPFVDNIHIHSNIIRSDQAASDQDAIYAGPGQGTGRNVYNNVIYDWTRAGINAQQYSGGSTQTWFIDHNLVYNTGQHSGEGESGISVNLGGSTGDTTFTCYNNAVFATNEADCFNVFDSAGGGSVTWIGSNNISDDSTAEDRFTGTNYGLVTITDNNSATGEVYTIANLTGDDFTSEENDGTGTDRLDGTGSSASSITVDILGNSRDGTTPDIGPFELQGGGGGSALTLFYHHYDRNLK